MKSKGKKVMVAMSGGVDSSVAALLLKESGHDVVGVTMCFSVKGGPSYRGNSEACKKPSCCGIDGIEDAKRVAEQLSIPHYVLNFAKDIEEEVVQDFIVEYISGRTPNPCVRCNQYLKFGGLLKKMRALGLDFLATGHFSRIAHKGKTHFLKKGTDKKKDQSYFLCQVERSALNHIVFPLGDMTKDEVREIARNRGLC
ncbi:MAG TPA: asparagine synthase-related protein, partial [Candidatus Omnitrophota bacterium]|nr:asparagine synthase-related protein [Candidatus Omnitrophota bacterium]